MTFFQRLKIASTAFRAAKGPPTSLKDPGEWLTRWFGGGTTTTGATVTPETSLRALAVYACVRIIAESVASLPIFIYRRRDDGGKDLATDHPLHAILHDSPNADLTSLEFREMMQSHLCLRGNAFAFIDWTVGGRVRRLMPLHPDRMAIKRNGADQLVYEYSRLNGTTDFFMADEILHLRGLSHDGVIGLSPIDLAREAVGLSLAAEEYGGRFFGQNTHIGVYLEHPGKLSETAYKNLKGSIEENHGGLQNSHRPFILEDGAKMHRLNMTADDAQFIETRKFQTTEIARLFRVPPHMIADLERATFSNIEQQGIDFVTHSLRPWLVRWEQRLSKSLLSESERGRYVIEHKIDALLRGESIKRAQALQIQRRNGIINADEWRNLENMNPIGGPEGQEYWQDKAMHDEPIPETEPANN